MERETKLLNYYVYAYIRSKDSDVAKAGTPYYIGKGSGKRAYGHHKWVSVPKDKTKIIFIETNLSEIGSLSIERRMILWWGRKDNNTGILLNLTDGGEGKSGHIRTEETKRKHSESIKGKRHYFYGKNHTQESKNKMGVSGEMHYLYGKTISESTKNKMSDASTGERNAFYGKTHSDETKQKISQSQLGKLQERVMCPHCDKIGGKSAMKRFHFDNCKLGNK